MQQIVCQKYWQKEKTSRNLKVKNYEMRINFYFLTTLLQRSNGNVQSISLLQFIIIQLYTNRTYPSL
jgi:hypothetical protein